MTRRDLPRFANARDGDLARLRRVIVICDHIAAAFVAFVVIGVMVLFANTVEEVRAMPRHLEGFP